MTAQPVLDEAALKRLRRLGGAELVRRMVELYLVNGPERVRALTEGAAAGDAGQVELAAHTLKSSAGNLGAMRLQETAESLESMAATGAIDEQMVARLINEYEESASALTRALEEESS